MGDLEPTVPLFQTQFKLSCLALLAGLDWNIAQKTGEKRFTDAHNTQMKIRIAKITLDTDTTKHAKNITIIHI